MTQVTSYDYDNVGNRTSVIADTNTSYEANNLNQYTTITENLAPRTLDYDFNGNLTAHNGWAYSYDYENRLLQAASPTLQANYEYDSFGRRIKKSVVGSLESEVLQYVYDGDQIIAEYDENGSLLRKYVYGHDSGYKLYAAGCRKILLSRRRFGLNNCFD